MSRTPECIDCPIHCACAINNEATPVSVVRLNHGSNSYFILVPDPLIKNEDEYAHVNGKPCHRIFVDPASRWHNAVGEYCNVHPDRVINS